MSETLQIELCPETGMCSIVRADKTKVDLLPDEVSAIAAAGDKAEAVRAIVSGSDEAFGGRLSPAELAQIARQLA